MAASQLSSTKAKATTAQHTVTSERSSLPETIGKRVDPDYSKTLHNKVKSIFGIHHDGFPGSQPVTFDAKHLRDLEREDYFVCEKNDGERYLLFFVHSPKGPAAFLFDRNRIWYYVPNLVFPLRGREKEYLKDTLMDGELVMDKDNDQTSWRFLVFDLMAINAVPVTQRSFNTRLGMAQQEVIQPFNASLRHVPRPPFTIELKKMERSYGLHLVFDQVAKSKHESDGVIFTPVKHPYVSGTCEKLLKWKPPEHHTVDFRISARWSKEHKPIYSLEVLSHGVTYKFYDQFQPEPALASQWKSHLPDGRIAEFRYDPNWEMTIIEQGYAPTTRKGGWRFVRFRDDKGAANDESMVKNTMRSIRNGVSKEQLLAHMDKVRTAWKAREKGLPMPSFSSSTTSKSTDTLSLSTSTNSNHQSAISPSSASILPSPSVGNSGGYFRDHHQTDSYDIGITSRQSSIDLGSSVVRRPSDIVTPEKESSPSAPKSKGKETTADTLESTKATSSSKRSSSIESHGPLIKEEEKSTEDAATTTTTTASEKAQKREAKTPTEDIDRKRLKSWTKEASHEEASPSEVSPPLVSDATSAEQKLPSPRSPKMEEPSRFEPSGPDVTTASTVGPEPNAPTSATEEAVKPATVSPTKAHEVPSPTVRSPVEHSRYRKSSVASQATGDHATTMDRSETSDAYAPSPKLRKIEEHAPFPKPTDASLSPTARKTPNKSFSASNVHSMSHPSSPHIASHPPPLSSGHGRALSESYSHVAAAHSRAHHPSHSIPDHPASRSSMVSQQHQEPMVKESPTKEKPASSSNIHSLLTTSVEPSTRMNADASAAAQRRVSSAPQVPAVQKPQKQEPRTQHPYDFATILQSRNERGNDTKRQAEPVAMREQEAPVRASRSQGTPNYPTTTPRGSVQFINYHAQGNYIQTNPPSSSHSEPVIKRHDQEVYPGEPAATASVTAMMPAPPPNAVSAESSASPAEDMRLATENNGGRQLRVWKASISAKPVAFRSSSYPRQASIPAVSRSPNAGVVYRPKVQETPYSSFHSQSPQQQQLQPPPPPPHQQQLQQPPQQPHPLYHSSTSYAMHPYQTQHAIPHTYAPPYYPSNARPPPDDSERMNPSGHPYYASRNYQENDYRSAAAPPSSYATEQQVAPSPASTNDDKKKRNSKAMLNFILN